MSKYSEEMQAIFHRYQRDVNLDPADLHDVAAWAIKKGLWKPRPADIRDRFSRDMAEALRQEYRVDYKGPQLSGESCRSSVQKRAADVVLGRYRCGTALSHGEGVRAAA